MENKAPLEEKVKKIIDVNTKKTDKKGILGLVELFLRNFKTLSFVVLLLPIVLGCLTCFALALFPAFLIYDFINEVSSNWGYLLHTLGQCFGVAISFFTFTLCLVFVTAFMNKLLMLNKFIKPWRGNWRSTQSFPWYFHNALVYIVRYTVLEFLTPSPISVLFYKMMGMKIGKGVIINTTNISDPCLIELGDYVTVGGSAHIMGHYGQKGYLVMERVVIKKGANLGLKCTIMGGAQIGEKAMIKPSSIVLPKTIIKDGEVY